jgi:23S rRNA pseudouridine2605 synthase
VLVNGEVGSAGQRVEPAADTIVVDGRPVKPTAPNVYLLLNKPPGVITTTADELGRANVMQLVERQAGLFPVGRLDRESRGLLLLTNDGVLAARLLHPRYHVEKEYRVLVCGRPSSEVLQRVREGVRVGSDHFSAAAVRIIRSSSGQSRLSMTLKEGRKREVRRIWEALGHPVLDLRRVRLGPLRLGDLPEGSARRLRHDEVVRLRKAAGL